MDTTITGIGELVVAQLRSAGYMESTIGQYGKSIRALTGYARRQRTSVYTPALGAGFASLTTSPRRAGSASSAGSTIGGWWRCSTPTLQPAGSICRFVNAAEEVHSRPGRSSWR